MGEDDELSTDVAPPSPDGAVGGVGAARRPRPRRTARLVLAGAVVVVLGAGSVALQSAVGDPGGPGGTSAPQSPSVSPTHRAPAANSRLVGVGHAAIAVPEHWGTNATRCGVPTTHTVVIDVGVVRACLIGRPAGVESVEVTQGEPHPGFAADRTLTIDGVVAQRQETRCERDVGHTRVCVGTVYLPSLQVSFRAESSTSAAAVDRLLEQIRVVPDLVGVPGHQSLAADLQAGSGKRYVEVLREAGFVAAERTEQAPGLHAGHVLDAFPRPGTMLAPGAVVTVTVAR